MTYTFFVLIFAAVLFCGVKIGRCLERRRHDTSYRKGSVLFR